MESPKKNVFSAVKVSIYSTSTAAPRCLSRKLSAPHHPLPLSAEIKRPFYEAIDILTAPADHQNWRHITFSPAAAERLICRTQPAGSLSLSRVRAWGIYAKQRPYIRHTMCLMARAPRKSIAYTAEEQATQQCWLYRTLCAWVYRGLRESSCLAFSAAADTGGLMNRRQNERLMRHGRYRERPACCSSENWKLSRERMVFILDLRFSWLMVIVERMDDILHAHW